MQMEEDESMKLELDLDGVILELEIKGLAGRYDLDDVDDIFELQLLWTKTDFCLHSSFIDYEMHDSEMMLVGEMLNIKNGLEALLKNEIKEDCCIAFADPDLKCYLYPARRLYSEPGKVIYREGYEDRELFLELQVSFWCDDGLSRNKFLTKLYRKDIETLLIYLKTVTGELSADDELVKTQMQAGTLILTKSKAASCKKVFDKIAEFKKKEKD